MKIKGAKLFLLFLPLLSLLPLLYNDNRKNPPLSLPLLLQLLLLLMLLLLLPLLRLLLLLLLLPISAQVHCWFDSAWSLPALLQRRCLEPAGL